MILVTGGAYQGKLEFAKSICGKESPAIAEGESASRRELEQADIVAHFHLYIKRLLEELQKEGSVPGKESSIPGKEDSVPGKESSVPGKEDVLDRQIQELVQNNPEVILEITQLGCGVVPMDEFDRSYRERVGRIGCSLAQQAEQVYLVNCGIPKRIK